MAGDVTVTWQLHAKTFIGYMMVTWYGDIPSFWSPSAGQSASYTPNFRSCIRLLSNQHFSLLLKWIWQNNIWPKIFPFSILQRLRRNLLSAKGKYSKSQFQQDLASFFTTIGQQQPNSNQHSRSKEPALSNQHSASNQHPHDHCQLPLVIITVARRGHLLSIWLRISCSVVEWTSPHRGIFYWDLDELVKVRHMQQARPVDNPQD